MSGYGELEGRDKRRRVGRKRNQKSTKGGDRMEKERIRKSRES